MIVKVTRKHIEAAEDARQAGFEDLGACCPLAQAMKDLGVIDPFVGPIYARGPGGRCFFLSRPARIFVAAFDGHQRVKPATFRLRPE